MMDKWRWLKSLFGGPELKITYVKRFLREINFHGPANGHVLHLILPLGETRAVLPVRLSCGGTSGTLLIAVEAPTTTTPPGFGALAGPTECWKPRASDSISSTDNPLGV